MILEITSEGTPYLGMSCTKISRYVKEAWMTQLQDPNMRHSAIYFEQTGASER